MYFNVAVTCFNLVNTPERTSAFVSVCLSSHVFSFLFQIVLGIRYMADDLPNFVGYCNCHILVLFMLALSFVVLCLCVELSVCVCVFVCVCGCGCLFCISVSVWVLLY